MQLSQQMKLSPRMIQATEILQMPMLQLQERIEQELESNIALEQVEPGVDARQIEEQRRDQVNEDRAGSRELVIGDETTGDAADFQRLNEFESSYSEASENEFSSQRFRSRRELGDRDRKMDAMANIAARSQSLTEQLLNQWTFAEVEPDVAAVGRKIIEYIDDDGFLSTDLATILDQNRAMRGLTEPLTAALLERTLRELQFWLDPPGLGARDVREALLLQVDDFELHDEEDANNWADVRLLIEDHLDDLLENRLPRIAQQTNLTLERIAAAKALMRKLNPAPGRELSTEDVPPVIPDVIVEFDEHADAYVAAMRNGVVPTLRINRQYEKMAKDRGVEKPTREFIANNVRNAQWLIESIQQRNSTLLRVVNAVLARQREFFDSGPQHLKPLPMTEVADQLGVDVSTVSRAVKDKWMQTPRGIYPLRDFFSLGRETDSGADMSWDAIKATLKEIVEGEDPARPLSDEALAQELKKRGIDIARRTVVKYRQQMDIPPARRRKVY
jgi:RNA polymerase sigma-54 factor